MRGTRPAGSTRCAGLVRLAVGGLAGLATAGLALALCAPAAGAGESGKPSDRDAGPPPLASVADRAVLLDDLAPGWHEEWNRKDFSVLHRNRYRPRREGDGRVLEIQSEDAAGGVYHTFAHEPPPPGRLTWRWKVAAPIATEGDERTEERDDFAARLFVVFETHVLPWKHKAICYVWAAREPVGAIFPSPHSDDIGTIVLRSGDAEAGCWVREERDVMADYRTYFGREPREISAVALMVDTDDTDVAAVAWFDDVVYEFTEASP
jgi:hypothetical protein